ncbi:MAG TPA: CoA-binding protein [Longimicrobiales bacterium]|nr:CoA-binding protein [Longimicrobiales bacterium]
MSTWRENLIEDPTEAQEALLSSHRLAILGIKTEQQEDQPAFYVSEYLDKAGYDVVPVPVYYPDCKIILGKPVCRQLAEVGHVDMVVVFRRPQDIPAHLDDIIAIKPKYVWFQLGIMNQEAAETLAKAGIGVIQDKCTLVEHRRAVARERHEA